MSAESTDAFHEDIRKRIEYFRAEYQLTYAEAIGVLAMAQYELLLEADEEADAE